MKIVVLNGSPKGESASRGSTCVYLERDFPSTSSWCCPLPKRSKELERDGAAFDKVIEEVRLGERGDLGISTVHPAGLLAVQEIYRAHRRARGSVRVPGKACRHAFHIDQLLRLERPHVHALGVRGPREAIRRAPLGRMDDLRPGERHRLGLFAEDFFASIKAETEFQRLSAALPAPPLRLPPVVRGAARGQKGKKIVILTDAPGAGETSAMVERLRDAWGGRPRWSTCTTWTSREAARDACDAAPRTGARTRARTASSTSITACSCRRTS